MTGTGNLTREELIVNFWNLESWHRLISKSLGKAWLARHGYSAITYYEIDRILACVEKILKFDERHVSKFHIF